MFKSTPFSRRETIPHVNGNIRILFKSTPFSRRETEGYPQAAQDDVFKSTPFSRRETVENVNGDGSLVFKSTPFSRRETCGRPADCFCQGSLNPLPSHEGRQQIFTKNHNAFCPYYPIFSFTNLSNLHSKQSNLLT